MIAATQAAPITFNTALPVAKDEFMLRQQFIAIESGDDPSTVNRNRSEIASITTLAYGVNNKLAVFGVVPYRDIEMKLDMGSQRVRRDSSGLGDITAFGRYIFHQNNQQGRSFRLAAFGGVKTPTGDDNSSDQFGILPPPVQTGSGSWDIFGGMVVTQQTLAYQFDGQLSYRVNNEAHDFEAGNVFRSDGSFQYRVWPRILSGSVPGFLYGVLEANLIYQEKNQINGGNDPNSGGTRLFISPGIQYVTRRWILEGSVQLPVRQELNGNALENDKIARAGFRVNF